MRDRVVIVDDSLTVRMDLGEAFDVELHLVHPTDGNRTDLPSSTMGQRAGNYRLESGKGVP